MKKLKKIVFAFVAMSLGSLSSHAQWTNLSSGTSNDLLGLHFPATKVGYVCGKDGTILKTTDTGKTWVSTTSAYPGYWFWDIHFSGTDTGFVVGETDPGTNPGGTGIIAKTTDGGKTWTNVYINPAFPIRDLFMLSKDTIYACGGAEGLYGTILKSVDQGVTWSVVGVTYMDAMLGGLYFLNSKVGFLGVYESVFGSYNPTSTTMLNTKDGGTSFGADVLPSSISYWVFSSDFGNSKIGYMSRSTYVGTDSVYVRKTTDGGTTWVETAIKGFTGTLRSLDFLDSDTGYFVGSSGFLGSISEIYKTKDGGKNWLRQTSPTTQELMGVQMLNASLGFAVGREGAIIKFSQAGGQPSAIFESEINKNWQVYPNPAVDFITLRYQGATSDVRFQLIDMMGRIVASDNLKPNEDFAISTKFIDNGHYILRLIGDDANIVNKLIVVRK